MEEAELLRKLRELRAADIHNHAPVEATLIFAGVVGILGAMYAAQTKTPSLGLLSGALWLGACGSSLRSQDLSGR